MMVFFSPVGWLPEASEAVRGRYPPKTFAVLSAEGEEAREHELLLRVIYFSVAGRPPTRAELAANQPHLGERLFALLGRLRTDRSLRELLGPFLEALEPCGCHPPGEGALDHLESLGRDYAYLMVGAFGFELLFNAEGALSTVFLHGQRTKSHAPFFAEPPRGLLFTDTRAAAAARLGAPQRSSVSPNGAPWDRWDLDHRAIHCEYSGPGGRVGLVTLMLVDSLPESAR